MTIRTFNAATDVGGLRSCLLELQDYECTLDPRMPPGAVVVEPLLREMMARCEAHNGRIFVAEAGREIAGYAAENGAAWLRIDVIANNTGARNLYAAGGFCEQIVTLEKSLEVTEVEG